MTQPTTEVSEVLTLVVHKLQFWSVGHRKTISMDLILSVIVINGIFQQMCKSLNYINFDKCIVHSIYILQLLRILM